MKLFFDSNVVFSAANEASNLHRFFLQLSESHILVTSDYARQEAFRNILAKRPQWETGYQTIILKITIVPGVDRPVPVRLACKDRPILATAIREECQYLVTDDKRDFGHLFREVVGDVTILTPLMLAEVLLEGTP